jgi:hypothetical protein
MISNFILEALALLAALYNLKHIRNTRYFYFIPLLAFTLLGELGASNFIHHYSDYVTGNMHIYLWITVFHLIFFGYQFYHIFHSKKWRLITATGITLAVSTLLFWFCFFPVYTQLFLNTHVAGGFLLCCLSCVYIYQEFVLSDDHEINLFHVSDFWMVMGILLYHAGISIVFALHYFLKVTPTYIWGMKIYHLFPRIASFFLYSFIIGALFLWKKNKNNGSVSDSIHQNSAI